MGLLGFIDTTFILTLGIVLLICGGIMIYCYRRLNALENGLIQQGRVMQEFITNYNLTMQMRDSTNNLSSSLANGGGNNNNINPDTLELQSREDKIVVSDDELSDDDDDDDDLSEQIDNIIIDDDISDVGTDIEEIINKNGPNSDRNIEVDSSDLTLDKLDIDLNTEDLQSAFIDALQSASIDDLQSASIDALQSASIDALQSVSIDALQSASIDALQSASIDALKEDLQSVLIENDNEKTDISSRIIPIVDIEGQDTSKKNPSRLKVDELRELVVNKNLVSNDEAQKLKKGELVRLLE